MSAVEADVMEKSEEVEKSEMGIGIAHGLSDTFPEWVESACGRVCEGLQRGGTVAHLRAALGDLEELQEIRAAGLSVDAPDQDGVRPLHLAAEFGHAACVRFLLEAGADALKADSDRWTPLHGAAAGTVECVELLLSHGARVNERDGRGRTPLGIAVGYYRLGVVERLLQAGADPNVQDREEGRVPLHFAAREGEQEMVELLLRHGAHVGVCDKEGKSPRDEAAGMRNWKMVALLGKAAEEDEAARVVARAPGCAA